MCPMPIRDRGTIILGHGSGGKLSHDLIKERFLPAFDNDVLRRGDDAGIVQPTPCAQLAISTDTHVVKPLFFPGGDIGRLAVSGTVNDVVVMGAQPLYLTVGFILEEGLEIGVLERIVESMQETAEIANVQIVAGDTKVVERGKADGVYINTAGVGLMLPATNISGANAQPGDVVIVSGTLGDHGIAVLSARGDLGFETDIQSDVAPLNKMVLAMLDTSENVHVLRDPTRGGLATTLNEIAQQSGVSIVLEEERLPIRPQVRAACEMLGFDPLMIANEGKIIAIAPEAEAEKILEVMRQSPAGQGAAVIGRVEAEPVGRVLLKNPYGSKRIVDMLMGEILPRIC
ncbi:MAG: hydrogenase expression/formation protein HypE [Ardenticatenaceae bacterium]|nr:hydrogenase expression/formation protein HypE [Ardenticatenaceae bacterium]